jgi:hypothetical protein
MWGFPIFALRCTRIGLSVQQLPIMLCGMKSLDTLAWTLAVLLPVLV